MQKSESNETKKYVGWVPCLNGELVFDLVECGLKAKDSEEISVIYYGKNASGQLIEYVLLYSVVDWKDFGDETDKGLWSVVLISERNIKSDVHEGMVFIKAYSKKTEESWQSTLEGIRVLNAQSKKKDVPELKEGIDQVREKLKQVSANDDSYYQANFELEQNGLVHLSYQNKGNSSDYLDGKLITRQSYYYIKYSWHRHQHHDSRSETLTTCHEFTSDSENEEIGRRLIGDLKRNLVRFKRSVDHSSHREVLKATGIVSYTKALVEILKTKKYIENCVYEKEIKHLGYFQESLETISAAIEKDIAMHNRAVNDARAIVLFVFALITPALVINRDAIANNFNNRDIPLYIKFICQLYSNQISFVIFIVFVFLTLIVLISMQTRYGNSWIFWRCFTKPIGYMLKDETPNTSMSKTQLISTSIMIVGLSLMIGFLVHLVMLDPPISP